MEKQRKNDVRVLERKRKEKARKKVMMMRKKKKMRRRSIVVVVVPSMCHQFALDNRTVQ